MLPNPCGSESPQKNSLTHGVRIQLYAANSVRFHLLYFFGRLSASKGLPASTTALSLWEPIKIGKEMLNFTQLPAAWSLTLDESTNMWPFLPAPGKVSRLHT